MCMELNYCSTKCILIYEYIFLLKNDYFYKNRELKPSEKFMVKNGFFPFLLVHLFYIL